MQLANPSQMQALDQTTIEQIGVPGIVLMENAGRITLDQIEEQFGLVQDKTVCLFIGPGNNGGDGLVIARHVLQRGGFPLLIFLVPPEKLSGDAATNAVICKKIGLSHYSIKQESDLEGLIKKIQQLHFTHPVHCLVDALFGTGLARKLEGRFATTVQLMNTLSTQQQWPLVAVDIPSGLCAQTGTPLGHTTKADLTVTYGLAKPGHYLHGGPNVGQLTVADIGIPEQVIQHAKLPGEVLEEQNIKKLLRPRHQASHKGSFGHLLILAGSVGKTGAAILAAKAAIHSGCGLVTLAIPASLNPIFETCLPEAMTVPLPNSKTALSSADAALLTDLSVDKDALVIGPGMGTAPESGELVNQLYHNHPLPMVVDADALNLLAEVFVKQDTTAGPRILTPHPGEMSRLIEQSTAEIQADRLKAAQVLLDKTADQHSERTIVLKGAGTVLASSQGPWAINSSGNHGMAAGGMGDVLAGLIGSLLAQGYMAWDASRIGVYLHGLAADLLAEEQIYGFTASEVATTLPQAMTKLRKNNLDSIEGAIC